MKNSEVCEILPVENLQDPRWSKNAGEINGIIGFQEFSFVDWYGKVVSVLFLAGCNMRCGYCHNHLLVNAPASLSETPYENVTRRLKFLKGWIDGVVVSGGEATLNKQVFRLLRDLRKRGFETKLDTNGLSPLVLSEIINSGLVDCVALDVKAPFSPLMYRRVVGKSVDIEKIRTSLRVLLKETVDYQLRITLSPVIQLSDYKELIEELKGAKHIILQKFRSGDILDPSLNKLKNFYDEDIRKLADFALNYVKKVTVSGVSK